MYRTAAYCLIAPTNHDVSNDLNCNVYRAAACYRIFPINPILNADHTGPMHRTATCNRIALANRAAVQILSLIRTYEECARIIGKAWLMCICSFSRCMIHHGSRD